MRGSFDIGRDVFEESSQDPDEQRKADQLIYPDQPKTLSIKPKLLVDEIKGNDDQNLRGEAEREKGEGDVSPAL